MATIKPALQIELDPRNPVPEISTVIMAVISYHPPVHEEAILMGVMEMLEKRWAVLKKGAEMNGKSLDEPGREPSDNGELGRAE